MSKRLKIKKKRKTLRRKTLKAYYGGAEKRSAEESNAKENNGPPLIRSRSEGFASALTTKEKGNKTNATLKLAIQIEKNKIKKNLLSLKASPKPGSISSETRLQHFFLAKEVIERIIDDNPSEETINIYASYITEENAPMLKEFLGYRNDNAELLAFMKLHDLSTLK